MEAEGREADATEAAHPGARELRSRRFARRIARNRTLYTRKGRGAAPGAEAG
jgi:hypothetical protein